MASNREDRLADATGCADPGGLAVGWSIGIPDSALVTNALGMAISSRNPDAGALAHSDQGTQFTLWAFTYRAKASELVPSMGSIGDRYDSAMIESLGGADERRAFGPATWMTRGRTSKCDLQICRGLPQPSRSRSWQEESSYRTPRKPGKTRVSRRAGSTSGQVM
ncbi:MAG: putative transposase [Actinomycetota bacterium]|jgi:transposase InsO family protein|nr:putative transposase [Actinomycetota bacterium]